MTKLTVSQIANVLKPYGVPVTEQICSNIRIYIDLLMQWNEKMALTTVTRREDIVRFHFGESIFALRDGLVRNGRLADVGSGAGFPGMALFLATDGINLTLIESNKKKCVFLREVVRRLDAEATVQIWQGRAEDFALRNGEAKFDYITTRAVGDFRGILSFSRSQLDNGGRVVLWVGGRDAEKIVREYGGTWEWSAPVRIPASENRYVLAGSPLSVPRGTT